jgi:peroxiredoxin-like protein
MKPLPHEYSVTATTEREGRVHLSSHELPTLESSPPQEFGGPGDRWSPEELLLAAVGDCFALTFRAAARASSLPWSRIEAKVDGVLSKMGHTTRFTEITIHAALTLEERDSHEAKALRLLAKAEKACLVSNSLAVPVRLEARVLP